MIWIGFMVSFICATGALCFWMQKRKLYRSVDEMMEEILDNKVISQIDLEEGQLSALAAKGKRIQEKLQIEVGQAEREKEQVKSLISNMSHQLKTPLANIMMYEEFLEDDTLARDKQKDFLKKMKSQSEKVHWILNSLFKMVKLEQNAIVFEAVPCFIKSTILDGVNRIYEKAERKNIEIVIEPFSDCMLYHNPKWTGEVFANILENAVKYTPEQGSIAIEMRTFELYAEIRIRDTGIGVAPKEMTEIFKRFYRGRDVENIEGSGIGLYLSKLILEKEKGYMNVASQKGEGSCFSVFLQKCQG